jgi:antitoxin ParD1/3/4
MTSINVNLPDGLKAFVDTQVAAGGYAGPSNYLQALVRQALEADQRLEAKLLVGIEQLDHGDDKEMTKGDWSRMQREYLTRHPQSRGPFIALRSSNKTWPRSPTILLRPSMGDQRHLEGGCQPLGRGGYIKQ